MNKSEVTLAILIDYSKAFDTIDQNILLEKLLKFNLEKDLNNLSQWSTNKNLLFNEDKTKSILLSISQLAQKHQLSDCNT